MYIPALPLVFIGWFFAILSFAALVAGVLLLQQLFRSGTIPPAYPQSRLIGDLALLVVWLIGLVSSFSLLNGLSWGRVGLEYFCWVLIALTLLSCATRLAAYARYTPDQRLTRRGWIVAIAGVLLVALPLIALCGASIFTLRAEQVRLHSAGAQQR